jgi:hypothetical protein
MTAEPRASARRRPDRTLLVLLAVVVGLVVVAIAVVLSTGTPALRPADTPEGVSQRYARAVISGDQLGAEEFLSESSRERCNSSAPLYSENVRVALVGSEQRGDAATVRVSVTVSYGEPPFGFEESTSDGVFRLVKEDGQWRIETVPWQLETCAGAL